jgi:hypothetical protein
VGWGGGVGVGVVWCVLLLGCVVVWVVGVWCGVRAGAGSWGAGVGWWVWCVRVGVWWVWGGGGGARGRGRVAWGGRLVLYGFGMRGCLRAWGFV